MAVPKRRMSRSNTRSRRAQWKTEATGLVNVTVAGKDSASTTSRKNRQRLAKLSISQT